MINATNSKPAAIILHSGAMYIPAAKMMPNAANMMHQRHTNCNNIFKYFIIPALS